MGRNRRGAALKLHILTAVSRPDNLTAMATSIAAASRLCPEVDLSWHCRFDLDRIHVGGQTLKNELLDQITDGWVVILDDDTVMHEQFLQSVYAAASQSPEPSAIVVSQRRTTGQVLVAAAENVAVGSIDAGQAILKRDLIADQRLPASYAGDGQWLEALLCNRDDVVYLKQVISLHNTLSGIDVSESPERMSA